MQTQFSVVMNNETLDVETTFMGNTIEMAVAILLGLNAYPELKNNVIRILRLDNKLTNDAKDHDEEEDSDEYKLDRFEWDNNENPDMVFSAYYNKNERYNGFLVPYFPVGEWRRLLMTVESDDYPEFNAVQATSINVSGVEKIVYRTPNGWTWNLASEQIG